MTVKRLRIVGIKHLINGLNPDFVTDIYHCFCNSTHKKYNLQVHNNTSRYSNKSLRIIGTHIWNSFSEDIKPTASIFKFKEFTKGWYGWKFYLCFNWPMSCLLQHIHFFSNLFNMPNYTGEAKKNAPKF